MMLCIIIQCIHQYSFHCRKHQSLNDVIIIQCIYIFTWLSKTNINHWMKSLSSNASKYSFHCPLSLSKWCIFNASTHSYHCRKHQSLNDVIIQFIRRPFHCRQNKILTLWDALGRQHYKLANTANVGLRVFCSSPTNVHHTDRYANYSTPTDTNTSTLGYEF